MCQAQSITLFKIPNSSNYSPLNRIHLWQSLVSLQNLQTPHIRCSRQLSWEYHEIEQADEVLWSVITLVTMILEDGCILTKLQGRLLTGKPYLSASSSFQHHCAFPSFLTSASTPSPLSAHSGCFPLAMGGKTSSGLVDKVDPRFSLYSTLWLGNIGVSQQSLVRVPEGCSSHFGGRSQFKPPCSLHQMQGGDH
jgi:hypothetical protein